MPEYINQKKKTFNKMKGLYTKGAIDNNLKPVIDDDLSNTPIEMSNKKVRTLTPLDVKGDLDVDGDVKVNGKITTIGGDTTTVANNSGASIDIESNNNIKLTAGENAHIQFFHGDNVSLEVQGGASGNNLKLYDAHDPTVGGVDFASLTAGTNGALTINTTSLSDADITLQCITGQIVLKSQTELEQNTLLTFDRKLYFDGGGDTYITSSTADVLTFKVGNANMLLMIETSDNNVCWFKSSAAGFTQTTVTYDATDTNANFTTSNKLFLTFGAGNIADLNLKFPDVSCNCQLVIKQDGTGSRTIASDGWLTTDQAGGNASTVKWAGGSPPTLSTGANAVDIISFYWDNENHTAYGVASLNFS